MVMAKKILIIDDEPDILKTISNRLKANDYGVLAVSSGEQGIQKARKEHPDVILLDCVMPGMSGADVLKDLKKDPVTKAIPVIIFTADVKELKIKEIQELGANGYLFKPFVAEDLLGKIQEVLKK